MDESDPYPCQKTNNSLINSFSSFDFLGSDLIELILSHLPITSVLRAASVCKLWNSAIHSSSFKTLESYSRPFPWLFLFAGNRYPLFAFDPESNDWIQLLKETHFLSDSFTASDGSIFSTSTENFSFKQPVFNGQWRQTSPLRIPRCNPLIGVFHEPDCSKQARFVVVCGISPVDREDCLAAEIYSPDQNCWELCQPLNEIFQPGNSAKLLCSAVFRGKFFVYDRCSCFISSFDLHKRFWSNPKTLRPPGNLVSSLISIQNRLVLAGLCSTYNGGLEFMLWNIDDTTLEFSEIAIMPQDLLSCLFDHESGQKFSSLRCAGSGRLVYVFNEKFSGDFPVCVCEMSDSGNCSWRRIPGFPESVNTFPNVVSLCFNVSLKHILCGREDEIYCKK